MQPAFANIGASQDRSNERMLGERDSLVNGRSLLMRPLMLFSEPDKPPKGFEKFFKKREETKTQKQEGRFLSVNQPTFRIERQALSII